MLDLLPNIKVKSEIVDYKLFVMFWRMLPDFIRIRVPQQIYSSYEDGLSYQTLLNRCSDYTSDFKFSLLLVRTIKGEIFGAFIDAVFQVTNNEHLGSGDSFVFTLSPLSKCFKSTGLNDYHLLCAPDYIAIGSEG